VGWGAERSLTKGTCRSEFIQPATQRSRFRFTFRPSLYDDISFSEYIAGVGKLIPQQRTVSFRRSGAAQRAGKDHAGVQAYPCRMFTLFV
jgi:hypothetical protein